MRDIAQYYRDAGWSPVRVPPMSKAPCDRDWPGRDYGPEAFDAADNIGIKLGDPSGGLVDVDLDCIEAVHLAPRFLPPTLTFGRTGKPRSHWLYHAPNTKTWKPSRTMVELRSTGGQTVFPGSTHHTGEAVVWHDRVALTPIDPQVLRACVARLAFASALLRILPNVQKTRATHDFVLALAGGLRRSGWNLDSVLLVVGESIGFGEPHRESAIRSTFDKEEEPITGWSTVEGLIGPPDARMLQRLAEDQSLGFAVPSPAVQAAASTGYVANDVGNAERLIDRFGENIRFAMDAQHGGALGWLRWDGTRWAPGDGPWLEASICARAIMDEGVALGGPAGKALAEWGRQSGNAGRIRACLEIASHRTEIRIDIDELDPNPWDLNCTNGTVDLRTGELRTHRREDLITKICPHEYDPAATCSRFDQFLRECMGSDEELASYLLRFLGYAITGLTTEHTFGLWYGPKGRNGKGVLIRLLSHVLGSYTATVPPDLLLQQANSQHPTGLMDFRGARLMLSNEMPEGRRWNESLVKILTGGDRIKARAMRQDFVEFAPSHTMILAANVRPLVREQGPAFWSRVSLLPWEVSFLGREDRDLDEKLANEAQGVLRYLVAGCLAWRGIGLRPPQRVHLAGNEYKESQDMIGAFIHDTLEASPPDSVPRSEVYATYRHWSQHGGEPYTASARVFYRQMEERQFQDRKRNGTRCYLGWKLKKSVHF